MVVSESPIDAGEFSDAMTILGKDAFFLADLNYYVTTGLRFGWMWDPSGGEGLPKDKIIVAFDNEKSFVLARLSGAFDGIKILGGNYGA